MSEVLRKMAVNVPADSLCPKVSANNDISLACLLPGWPKAENVSADMIINTVIMKLECLITCSLFKIINYLYSPTISMPIPVYEPVRCAI